MVDETCRLDHSSFDVNDKRKRIFRYFGGENEAWMNDCGADFFFFCLDAYVKSSFDRFHF